MDYPASQKPDVSIIIPTWNSRQLTMDCLASLMKQPRTVSLEIIVIDNNSNDGTSEAIHKLYSAVKIIHNQENKGFAEPNNQGYAVSKGRYIFLLNNDTIVPPGAIKKMVDFLDTHEEYGAVTCKLLNDDGSTQYFMHRRFPSAARLPLALLYKRIRWFKPWPVTQYLYLDKDFATDFDVEQAAAAAVLIRRQAIEDIGELLDADRFRVYYNDVDLCYRLWQKGWKIRCLGEVAITHLKGKTTGSLAFYKNADEYVYSSLQFFKKHNKWLDHFVLRAMYVILFTFLGVYSTLLYLVRQISDVDLTRRWHVLRAAVTLRK